MRLFALMYELILNELDNICVVFTIVMTSPYADVETLRSLIER